MKRVGLLIQIRLFLFVLFSLVTKIRYKTVLKSEIFRQEREVFPFAQLKFQHKKTTPFPKWFKTNNNLI